MPRLTPTFALALLCTPLAVARSAGEDRPKAPPGVKAQLVLSVDEYDPSKPSKGVIKCVVTNGSADPIEVTTGYDCKQNRLNGQGKGHGWELLLYPDREAKVGESKRVTVKPGGEQVVFELSLDDILYQGVKGDPREVKGRAWQWDWAARPESPASPVHNWRKPGFVEEAQFWADVTVDGNKLAVTEKAVLKVKPGQPEKE